VLNFMQFIKRLLEIQRENLTIRTSRYGNTASHSLLRIAPVGGHFVTSIILNVYAVSLKRFGKSA
jgi:hypothetical protein